tara:strand:- start:505 stop:678 length:174 start_codon:yes stop_codon:yes gene_type:complete
MTSNSDPKKKLAELNAEIKKMEENYNKAVQVVENCKIRIYELRGAIATLEEMTEKTT